MSYSAALSRVTAVGMVTKIHLLFANTAMFPPVLLPLFFIQQCRLNPTMYGHCAKHGHTCYLLSFPIFSLSFPPFLPLLSLPFLSPAPCFPDHLLYVTFLTGTQGLSPPPIFSRDKGLVESLKPKGPWSSN